MDLSRALAGAYASAAGAQGASVGWGDATRSALPGTGGPSSLPYSATDLVQAFSLPGLDSASQGLAGLLPPELFAAMVQAGYATLGYQHNNNSSASGANNTAGANNNNARNGQAQGQQQQQQQPQSQALDPASSLRAALAAGAASDRQQQAQRGSPPASTSDLADAYAFRNAAAAGAAAAAAAAAANNPAAAFGAFAQGTNAGVNYSAALSQYAGANAAAQAAAMGMRPPACPPQFGPQVGAAQYMQQGFLPYAFGGRDAQSAAAYSMAQQLAAAAGAYGFGQGGYGGAMDPYAQMQAAAAAAAQYRAMPQAGVQAPPPSNQQLQQQAKELTEDDYIDDGSTRAVKRLRLVWTDKLHLRFEEALAKLGPDAVPKSILQEMGVEGITRENVASHLQKYRLQKKKKEGSDGTTGRTSPTSSSPRPMSGGNSGQVARLEQHPIWASGNGQERGKGGVVRHHSGAVKASENHGSGSNNNGNRNGDAPRRSVAPSPNRDAQNGTSRPLRSPPAHTAAAPRGPLSNLPEASTPSGISKGCAAEASAEADGEQQAEHAAKRQCISA